MRLILPFAAALLCFSQIATATEVQVTMTQDVPPTAIEFDFNALDQEIAGNLAEQLQQMQQAEFSEYGGDDILLANDKDTKTR
ncbi:hypothetical protein NFHSH190041_26810 [Shewanella sp. NFH-SH190041]|uniref:hypothetical protein n=1 Tax=Shewanella sp. NFH-SH190041 TaxID=2950245 RepID=UPI0021C33D8D|nr:hypothetical protein [Shewanella sp. NFH-SH190041]BDM65229.1 hypothetical protein NFHSH190041_26810 [Shewanella sp. NFH-SH190041]